MTWFWLLVAFELSTWLAWKAFNRRQNRKMWKLYEDYMADKKAREEEECSESSNGV